MQNLTLNTGQIRNFSDSMATLLQSKCSLFVGMAGISWSPWFSFHCDSWHVGRNCKSCWTELNNAFPNLSALPLLPTNAYFLPVSANLPPRLILTLLLMIQPLDFIVYKIQSMLYIMTTVDSLFLPKAALISIYLLLQPLSSKLLTPPSADKNNSCTA